MKHHNTPTLHLLLGLPGSGKTTFAKTLQQVSGAVRITSDEQRIKIFPSPTFSDTEHEELYGAIDEQVKQLLKQGRDVIYDANLNRKVHRDEKYVLAKKYSANTKLWWIQTDPELSKKRRVDEQDHMLLPAGETPERMFDRIQMIFEAPTTKESYIGVDGTKITEAYVKQLLEG